MKTSRQCVYAHAKQVQGNGQFQQANDNMDINFSYEQTTMKRATCFRSLDGIKDADKFNSKYKCSIMRNAEMSVMKKNL